jgi:hypothetical protein
VEKLQLQHDFPTNLLVKTYDALCESCRTIAPLKLLFLEIFLLVGNFENQYAELNTSRATSSPRQSASAHASKIEIALPCADSCRCRHTDAPPCPLWTHARPRTLRPNQAALHRVNSHARLAGRGADRATLLTVNSCIKVRFDLQTDKSPVVDKGPFFPRVVNPRYRIRGTMCNARIQSSKAR